MRSRTARIFSAWASAAGSGRFSRRSSSSCATRSMCAVRSAWEEVRDATLRSHARTAGATRRWRPETRVVRERGGRREGPREGVGGVREEEAHESGERERVGDDGTTTRREPPKRARGGRRSRGGAGRCEGRTLRERLHARRHRARGRETSLARSRRDVPGRGFRAAVFRSGRAARAARETPRPKSGSHHPHAGVLTRLPAIPKAAAAKYLVSPRIGARSRADALRIARRIFASPSRWRPGPPCVAASRSSRRRTVARAPRTARRRGPAPKRSISTGALGDRGASPRRARAVAPARDPRSARLAPARSPSPLPAPEPTPRRVLSGASARSRRSARSRSRAKSCRVLFLRPDVPRTLRDRQASRRDRAPPSSRTIPVPPPGVVSDPSRDAPPLPLLPARSKSLPAGSSSRPRASPRARRVRPPPRAASPRIPPAISPRIRSSRSRPSPPR